MVAMPDQSCKQSETRTSGEENRSGLLASAVNESVIQFDGIIQRARTASSQDPTTTVGVEGHAAARTASSQDPTTSMELEALTAARTAGSQDPTTSMELEALTAARTASCQDPTTTMGVEGLVALVGKAFALRMAAKVAEEEGNRLRLEEEALGVLAAALEAAEADAEEEAVSRVIVDHLRSVAGEMQVYL